MPFSLRVKTRLVVSCCLLFLMPILVLHAQTGFVPSLDTGGLLLHGEQGLLGERIEWLSTIHNTSTTTGTNLVIMDTLPSELRIDRVESSSGTYLINGQTIVLALAELAPDDIVTLRIITTVLEQEKLVYNNLCLRADGLERSCINSPSLPTLTISKLPAAGETPRWRDSVIVFGLLLAAGLVHYFFLRPTVPQVR